MSFLGKRVFLNIINTSISISMILQQKTDGDQQGLNGVTEILKFGASLVEGFIALMGQKVGFVVYVFLCFGFIETIMSN